MCFSSVEKCQEVILSNFYWIECLLKKNQGVRGKVNFFVNEVSFENVVKVMGFTYVFENG